MHLLTLTPRMCAAIKSATIGCVHSNTESCAPSLRQGRSHAAAHACPKRHCMSPGKCGRLSWASYELAQLNANCTNSTLNCHQLMHARGCAQDSAVSSTLTVSRCRTTAKHDCLDCIHNVPHICEYIINTHVLAIYILTCINLNATGVCCVMLIAIIRPLSARPSRSGRSMSHSAMLHTHVR